MIGKDGRDLHNELVLRASGAHIRGVAVKTMVRSDGSLDRPAELSRIRQIAAELEVPFVEIQERCALPDLAPKAQYHKDGRLENIYLQRDGVGYFLNARPDFPGRFSRYFHSAGNDQEEMPREDYALIKPQLDQFFSTRPELSSFHAEI